jgi:RNA polymerase sigma-70 factor (ECF subfamily)
MNDAVLAEALQAGSPDVLDRLLARFGTEIQTVAYLILRDHQDAEDVVVETLLAALQHLKELRDPTALRPWLLRIATNRALGVRRRGARMVHLEVLPDPGSSRDATSESATRLTLLAGVDALPARMRAAVVLRYYADLSVEEVAVALGRSPNTIKSQLQVALDHLRRGLADPPGKTALAEASHD